MRNNFVAMGAAFLVMSFAAAFTEIAMAAYSQTAPPAGNVFIRNAFEHPNSSPPTGSTIFRSVESGNLFTAQLLANLHQESQRQAMQAYTDQINQMVEKAYKEYGYEQNDMGAALGACLETCWEISVGSFKTEAANAQEKEKTKATIRQIQNSLLASADYKALAGKNKQILYEACTFMTGHLAAQWMQGKSVPAQKAVVQEAARKQLQTVFGIAASSLKRNVDGTFVTSSVVASSTEKKEKEVTNVKPGGADLKPAATVNGSLPAASAHGARFFVKYVFEPTKTRFGQLILFPSGVAFTDLPSKPVAQFDEATLRASLKPFDVGNWKEAGNTLVLTFPNKKRDQVTTLRKVPRGWYDGDGALKADSSYNTYFPVVSLTPAQITGAWHSQSLMTMGAAGGAAPLVAHGSSSDRVFNADGTFSEGKTAFTSATTANVGDGFKSGGDVGVYNTNNKKGAGLWRLDGPLITLAVAGKRTVTLAFVLPHWNKTGTPELLIDGDWWRRPEKER